MRGMRLASPGCSLLALASLCTSCTTFTAPDRAAGERAPLTRPCDELDPTHCLLPWPSSAFTEADPSTATGLRLRVDVTSANPRDDSEVLSRADGFSRVSSVLAGFEGALDASTLDESSLRLVLAQHDHPGYGGEVALRREVVVASNGAASAVVGHPLRPLAANADYVGIVTDALRAEDGSPLEASHETRVVLGLDAPRTQAEADLAGYHAPTRALLETIGVDPARVLRVWDFTTRSEQDPRRRLAAMRDAAIAAVGAGEVAVEIDEVEHRTEGAVATIVRGRLTGLPSYVVDRELSVASDGSPLPIGTHDAPFRVAIPPGEGDYRMLMYGHGTGGTVDDSAFDDSIAELGAAKVNVEFYGWTEATVIDTFLELDTLVHGSSIAAAGLVQAIADTAAVRRAMSGVIGDALAAPELLGAPNPHAGRRPDDSVPMWVGGSLGGTMGLLYIATDPEVRYAVLNVAGAAWGTWVRDAYQFELLRAYVQRANGGAIGAAIMVSAGQTLLDEADGASWVEELERDRPIALVQESIGDPVLPNDGTHVVARVLGATQVGAPLVRLDDLPAGDAAAGASALTQYRVSATRPLDVHGFAARSGPEGDAAREQILEFVRSVWDGAPRVDVPSQCAAMSCDFTR